MVWSEVMLIFQLRLLLLFSAFYIKKQLILIKFIFLEIISQKQNIKQLDEMSLDNQYNQQRDHFIRMLKPNMNLQPLILQLLKSKNYQTWKILQEILMRTQQQEKGIFKRILQQVIERNIDLIQNFTMFIYVYSIKVTKKLSYFGSYKWSRLYRQFTDKSQITIFTSWVESDPSSKIAQQSLKLVAYIFPIFHKDQYILLTEIDMGSIIEWVSYFHTSTSHEYEDSCKLVKIAKQSHTLMKEDFVEKQHVIMKRLIDICGKNKDISANIFLFLYPINLKQKDISYFCHVYSQYLKEMSEQVLCNFFKAITKSAITIQILQIISKISQFLKNQQQYYKLRYLFQNFILPILCRRIKTCTKNKIQQSVYDICQFYILGFLKTLCLGNNGIQCIAKNISKVKNDKIKVKWFFICDILCSEYPKLKPSVQDCLSKQLRKQFKVEIGDYEKIRNNSEIVWNVTIRNSRKLKNYVKIPSKYKGIKNFQNQCYIITVVQALQKGKNLQRLIMKNLEKIKRLDLLNELSILFAQISGQKQAKQITIRYLKNKGPPQYKDSVSQQDAYQYLGHLIQSLEKQMANIPKMLDQFKKIYQMKCLTMSNCKNCHNKKPNQFKSYVYSLHNTEILKQQTTELICDFYCDNCSQKTEAQIKTTIVPECSIFIVQINRFSYQKGTSKKQLSTQTILRNFLQYTLVGMICHRGKNIQHGHYVYYHRINAKRWILFNDSTVQQFDLSSEDEQFERQWKAELTPFILFYQNIDQ